MKFDSGEMVELDREVIEVRVEVHGGVCVSVG